MALVKQIDKVKLICGVMYSDNYDDIKKKLIEKYGSIDFESEKYDFNFTDYYEKEMGKELKKKIISFESLIEREKLAEIKIDTNNIENNCKKNNKRIINLDPGYMTKHNVILASAKEMPHKVYIGKGLFGDPVLEFRKKEWQDFRHTFPDFRTDLVKDFLLEIRKIYLEQLK